MRTDEQLKADAMEIMSGQLSLMRAAVRDDELMQVIVSLACVAYAAGAQSEASEHLRTLDQALNEGEGAYRP